MTSKELAAWMDAVGLNKRTASSALGVSRTTLDAYLEGRHVVPRYIALACAAIHHRINPWGSEA